MYMDFYLTPPRGSKSGRANRPIEILERVDDEKAGGYIFWARRTGQTLRTCDRAAHERGGATPSAPSQERVGSVE